MPLARFYCIARSFYDYDENGEIVVEWLEVWDGTYLTRLKKTGERYQNVYAAPLSGWLYSFQIEYHCQQGVSSV